MADILAARRIIYPLPEDASYRINDPVTVINRLFCGWFVRDRFNILNKYQPFRIADVADEFPAADSSLNMGDICDARAKEILALNQPITVMWSGGVDSTAILSSFLKNGIDKSLLTVAYAPSSILEYPWFHRHLKDLGIKMVQTDRITDYINSVEEGLIVSGWCADQLFGSNIHVRNNTLYNLPWIDGLKQAFQDRGIYLSTASFDVIGETWDEYFKALNLPVEQFCEFAWLYNFGFKWSYVSQDTKLSLLKQDAKNRVVNFFEDPRFQQWSVAHFPELRDVNVNAVRKYYKQPLKQYIYFYTEDPDYLLHKGKVNSWAQVKDKVDYDYVEVLDTDGYHIFKAKNPLDMDIHKLREEIAKLYLKPEYLI